MICRNPDCEVGGEVAVGCLDANGKYFVFCSDCYIQGPYRDTHAEAVDAYRNGVDGFCSGDYGLQSEVVLI